MFIISADKLGVSFGEKVLFDKVSFSVNQGDKLSIVGVNGAGKSTLMRLLYDKSVPFSGNVFIAKGKTVGHLEQQSRLNPDETVYEAALKIFRDLAEKEARLEEMAKLLEKDYSAEQIARYTRLQQEFQRDGGYEYKSRVAGTLTAMGLDEEKQKLKVSALSGGQKTILQLAILLLEEPDILLLDEPTNHLDIKSLEWLEDKLKKIRSTLIIISHDRLFLDRVTNKTLEIENAHGTLYNVPYSAYREQKRVNREIQEKHYKNQQKEIARMEAFIAQQKRWNREKNIIAAESRQKALDRMVKVEKVESAPLSLAFRFAPTLESGDDVLSVKNLKKSYPGVALFEDLSFEVKKKDRLVVIGANGSGKSTLLQILAGNTPSDSGEFRTGYNVRMGYYDQYQHLNEQNTVLDEIWSDSDANLTQIRSLLATFLFRGDDVFKEIRVLSGGEKARLVLAKLMQKKVNLLLLDEPTNHLDIESREALEDALLAFEGTIIAVSHDRYFVNKIATRILAFEGSGKQFQFSGKFEDYQNYLLKTAEEEKKDGPSLSAGQLNWELNKKKKQEERKRKNRIEKIEKEIEEAEEKIRLLDEEATKLGSDYVALQKIYEEKQELEEKCNALLEEWTGLCENE